METTLIDRLIDARVGDLSPVSRAFKNLISLSTLPLRNLKTRPNHIITFSGKCFQSQINFVL